MIAAELGACERLEVLERTVRNGSEHEISKALAEIDALAEVVWRRPPVTFADIRERALIVRANMDKDASGMPVADCPLALATAHLVDAILRLTDG